MESGSVEKNVQSELKEPTKQNKSSQDAAQQNPPRKKPTNITKVKKKKKKKGFLEMCEKQGKGLTHRFFFFFKHMEKKNLSISNTELFSRFFVLKKKKIC